MKRRWTNSDQTIHSKVKNDPDLDHTLHHKIKDDPDANWIPISAIKKESDQKSDSETKPISCGPGSSTSQKQFDVKPKIECKQEEDRSMCHHQPAPQTILGRLTTKMKLMFHPASCDCPECYFKPLPNYFEVRGEVTTHGIICGWQTYIMGEQITAKWSSTHFLPRQSEFLLSWTINAKEIVLDRKTYSPWINVRDLFADQDILVATPSRNWEDNQEDDRTLLQTYLNANDEYYLQWHFRTSTIRATGLLELVLGSISKARYERCLPQSEPGCHKVLWSQEISPGSFIQDELQTGPRVILKPIQSQVMKFGRPDFTDPVIFNWMIEGLKDIYIQLNKKFHCSRRNNQTDSSPRFYISEERMVEPPTRIITCFCQEEENV